MNINDLCAALVDSFGKDVLESKQIQKEKEFIQHGNTTVFEHSYLVACKCLKIAYFLDMKVDVSSLVRGALLHDYFLYDWHDKKNRKPHHAYKHPLYALNNAKKDFKLNGIEKNMISSHMFPLCFVFPKYRESFLLCLADKISAVQEMKAIKRKVDSR